MLHEIVVELNADLSASGCPIRVIDGYEPTRTTTYARERIVIEHDDGDTFSATRSQHRNPSIRMIRNVSARATIYAQSAAPNALDWEHYRRAEHVLDMFLVALERVLLSRKNAWSIRSGSFARPDDLRRSETPGGAVYALTFSYERGIYEQRWNGSVAQEISGVPILSTDQITTANGPPSQIPETGC